MFYSRASPPLKKRFLKTGLYIPGPVATSISTPHHWMSPSFVFEKQLLEWMMRDQSSRHYKDNSKKDIAWRAIALEIGSSGMT
ncbi:unnamed protein product [Arctogadus glacialis]